MSRGAVAQSVERLSLVQLYWRGFESRERPPHLSLRRGIGFRRFRGEKKTILAAPSVYARYVKKKMLNEAFLAAFSKQAYNNLEEFTNIAALSNLPQLRSIMPIIPNMTKLTGLQFPIHDKNTCLTVLLDLNPDLNNCL